MLNGTGGQIPCPILSNSPKDLEGLKQGSCPFVFPYVILIIAKSQFPLRVGIGFFTINFGNYVFVIKSFFMKTLHGRFLIFLLHRLERYFSCCVLYIEYTIRFPSGQCPGGFLIGELLQKVQGLLVIVLLFAE